MCVSVRVCVCALARTHSHTHSHTSTHARTAKFFYDRKLFSAADAVVVIWAIAFFELRKRGESTDLFYTCTVLKHTQTNTEKKPLSHADLGHLLPKEGIGLGVEPLFGHPKH